ncbi:hypothetical protein VYU27_001471 [Nannochloropsis oceanica]
MHSRAFTSSSDASSFPSLLQVRFERSGGGGIATAASICQLPCVSGKGVPGGFRKHATNQHHQQPEARPSSLSLSILSSSPPYLELGNRRRGKPHFLRRRLKCQVLRVAGDLVQIPLRYLISEYGPSLPGCCLSGHDPRGVPPRHTRRVGVASNPSMLL